jgi:hypothetical protein
MPLDPVTSAQRRHAALERALRDLGLTADTAPDQVVAYVLKSVDGAPAPASTAVDQAAIVDQVDRWPDAYPLDQVADARRALRAQGVRPARKSWAQARPQAATTIRVSRDTNVDKLIERQARFIIDAPGGLFATLKPSLARPVQVHEKLVKRVTQLLRSGFRAADIERALAPALAAHPGVTSVDPAPYLAVLGAIKELRDSAERGLKKRFGSFEQWPLALQRLNRIHWLERNLPQQLRSPFLSGVEELASCIDRVGTDQAAVFELIDTRFETALDNAIRAKGVPLVETCSFRRLPARIAPVVDVSAQQVGPDDPVAKNIDDLRVRLARGEQSAVGGEAYTLTRLDESLLDEVAEGSVRALVYNGSPEAAVDYLRAKYGTHRGRQGVARVMGLQGSYSSGSRQLVTLEDGQRFLVLSGQGDSRMTNNADILLLYDHSATGTPIQLNDIELAREGTDLVELYRQQITQTLSDDLAVTGTAFDADTMPTQLFVCTNPDHLDDALPGRIRWGKHAQQTDPPMAIAYWDKDDGSCVRLLIPKVGGDGLYGDTAGDFVKAFFTTDVGKRCPHMIFNGTAGGFRGTDGGTRRGLGEVIPGGLILPVSTIEQVGSGERPRAIAGLLSSNEQDWPDELKQLAADASANVVDDHACVPAPAAETSGVIEELVSAGKASVELETYSILKAVEDLNALGVRATFTPVLTHSDDPREALVDINKSLAKQGFLFEKTSFRPQMWRFLIRLLETAQADT